MIILGETYFWKFLEGCDVAFLDRYVDDLRSVLSDVMGTQYNVEQLDSTLREKLARWSKGYFNAPGELNLQFPRVSFVFQKVSDHGERWIADVFFTRVPHIRGIYSNRGVNHSLPGSIQKELSRRLVESQAADVFTCRKDETFVGTVNGLYVHQKMQHLAALRNLAEDSKYTPQGSDLKELLQDLARLFSEGKSVPESIELPTKRGAIRDFLEKCDSRVAGSLGDERLEALLRSTGVSAKQWLNAGRQKLLERLWSGG